MGWLRQYFLPRESDVSRKKTNIFPHIFEVSFAYCLVNLDWVERDATTAFVLQPTQDFSHDDIIISSSTLCAIADPSMICCILRTAIQFLFDSARQKNRSIILATYFVWAMQNMMWKNDKRHATCSWPLMVRFRDVYAYSQIDNEFQLFKYLCSCFFY